MLKEDERVAYQAAFNTFDWLKKWNKNWQIILPMMMTMLSRMTMMVITNLMKTFNMVMTIMVIRNMMKTSRMMMTMLSKMVKTNMMKTIVMTIMVMTMMVMTMMVMTKGSQVKQWPGGSQQPPRCDEKGRAQSHWYRGRIRIFWITHFDQFHQLKISYTWVPKAKSVDAWLSQIWCGDLVKISL